MVFVVQFFFGGQIWYLLLLPAPAAASAGSGQFDVMEDDQGPVGSYPTVALSSNHPVQVVHALFVVLVVQDDG